VILLAAILLTALAASGLLLLKWRLAAIRLGVPQPAHTAVVEKRVMVHITLTGHSNSATGKYREFAQIRAPRPGHLA
jgi:hypothetical protein